MVATLGVVCREVFWRRDMWVGDVGVGRVRVGWSACGARLLEMVLSQVILDLPLVSRLCLLESDVPDVALPLVPGSRVPA